MYDIIIGRNEQDKEKYGTEGTVLLGKHYVKMGRTTSLSNKILLDVIRSHVLFVCGKRGGGKCLTGDSLITLENGEEIPIKDLENNNSKILSLDKDLKIKSFQKTNFFKREVSELLKITLRSGKQIKLTPEHPLFTINGWKPAKKLSLGTRIATPRRIPCFGKDKIEDDKIKLLAYLLTEGHTKKAVLFSNIDKKIVNEFETCLKSIHPKIRLIKIKEGCYKISSKNEKRKVLSHDIKRDNKGRISKGSSITHQKTSIRKYLEKHGLYGLSALEKYVPEKIFKVNKRTLSLFLNRMFSCDGSIYKPYKNKDLWEVSYSSSSEKMARQIHGLLLRFSIIAKLRTKKIKYKESYKKSFEIVIKGENVIKFIKEIGFFGKKETKQKTALTKMMTIKRNTNIDIIPKEIWDSYRPKNWAEIGGKMNYSTPKALRSSINYSPSRQKLLQIAQIDNNQKMEVLAKADIFWDEIVSMEKLEGKFTVYDISVPEAHNFVANNIIVHNSYTMGVIAEGIIDLPPKVKNNISVIMLDTMGVYWTMKYPNKKDELLLEEWGLKPKGLDITIYTPVGYFQEYKDKGIPTDASFSVKPSELNGSDWCMTFDISQNEPIGILIEKMIHDLRDAKKNYSMNDILEALKKSAADENVKNAALNLFGNANTWGLFDIKGTPLSELARPGQVTVLDVSCYATMPGGWRIKSLVIGLIAQKLFIQRMIARKNEEYEQVHKSVYYFSEEEIEKLDFPMVWLIIDECLPYDSQIQTDKGIKKIGDIHKEILKGKKINALGYDQHTKKYGFHPVTKSYKRPKKLCMAFITETGKSITCTPDHKIFSSKGFCEAKKAKDVAIPLLKPRSRDKKLIEARLLGYIFGDGWISTNGKSIGFSGKGNNRDLEKIKQDLALIGLKSSSIYSKETKSRINSSAGKTAYVKGMSHSITSSTFACNHFKKLGAPIGTKVLVPSKVPSWIIKGTKEVKAEFLAGLMGADGYIISRNINYPSDFNPIRISFNKITELEKNAYDFANQLKKIFSELGVKVSNIVKQPGNIRKDGYETLKIQITLAKSVENTINYLENIGYRYCEKKEIEGEKWLHYLRYRKNTIIERSKLRTKAIKLHKEKGLGKIKIGRMLELPDYVIREWIYYKGKAGMPKNAPSFMEWTKKRVSGDNLFVKIIDKKQKKEEVVYDLSVDKIHNFVADGFLVHNCHEFLPNKGKTLASDPLITILREGRQPGISLILASQQPGKIHTDVMTQADTIISHRITAKIDIDALGALMQSYLRGGLDKYLDDLPRVKGAAIILDDSNEKMYPMRVRPRFTWHGGEAPTAIQQKDKIFDN